MFPQCCDGYHSYYMCLMNIYILHILKDAEILKFYNGEGNLLCSRNYLNLIDSANIFHDKFGEMLGLKLWCCEWKRGWELTTTSVSTPVLV